jgi:hypothetical protein
MLRENLEHLLENLIGERLVIKVNSTYIHFLTKFKLSSYSFSGGAHRSAVSNVMIKDTDVSLRDDKLDISFQFEYVDIECVVKNEKEKCELHLIYRDGTHIMIYKECNF